MAITLPYRIYIFDTNGKLVSIPQDILTGSFEDVVNGGSGAGQFALPRRFVDVGEVNYEYRVQFFLADSVDPWYDGRIVDFDQDQMENKDAETITVYTDGWRTRLSYAITSDHVDPGYQPNGSINALTNADTFLAAEIATKLDSSTFGTSYLSAIPVALDKMSFDGTELDKAIEDIVKQVNDNTGNTYEWWVRGKLGGKPQLVIQPNANPNKVTTTYRTPPTFTGATPSAQVPCGYNFEWKNSTIQGYKQTNSGRQIYNMIAAYGGPDPMTKYPVYGAFKDSTSISLYGLRQKKITNSNVTSQKSLSMYATVYLLLNGYPQPQTTFKKAAPSDVDRAGVWYQIMEPSLGILTQNIKQERCIKVHIDFGVDSLVASMTCTAPRPYIDNAYYAAINQASRAQTFKPTTTNLTNYFVASGFNWIRTGAVGSQPTVDMSPPSACFGSSTPISMPAGPNSDFSYTVPLIDTVLGGGGTGVVIAPKIVQFSEQFTNDPTTVTLTYATPPTGGNLMVAFIRWNAPGAITPPAGWTQEDVTTANSINYSIFWKIATASDINAFVFQRSSSLGYPEVFGAEFSNTDTTIPFDKHTMTSVPSDTSYSTASITPGLANTLPIAILDNGTAAKTSWFGLPAGWSTNYASGANGTLFSIAQTSTSAQQLTASSNQVASGYTSTAWIASIRPGPAVAVNPNGTGDGRYEVVYASDPFTTFGVLTHTPAFIVIKGNPPPYDQNIMRGWSFMVINSVIAGSQDLRTYGGISAANINYGNHPYPKLSAPITLATGFSNNTVHAQVNVPQMTITNCTVDSTVGGVYFEYRLHGAINDTAMKPLDGMPLVNTTSASQNIGPFGFEVGAGQSIDVFMGFTGIGSKDYGPPIQLGSAAQIANGFIPAPLVITAAYLAKVPIAQPRITSSYLNPSYDSQPGITSALSLAFGVSNQPADGSLGKLVFYYRILGQADWSFYARIDPRPGTLNSDGVTANAYYDGLHLIELTNGQVYEGGVAYESLGGKGETAITSIGSRAAGPSTVLAGLATMPNAIAGNGPQLATAPAPSAPTLSAVAGTSPGTAVYVIITFANVYGETVGSGLGSIALTAAQQAQVASPAAAPQIDGYNTYACATPTGTFYKQNTSLAVFGTAFIIPGTLVTGTATPPTTNTASYSPSLGTQVPGSGVALQPVTITLKENPYLSGTSTLWLFAVAFVMRKSNSHEPVGLPSISQYNGSMQFSNTVAIPAAMSVDIGFYYIDQEGKPSSPTYFGAPNPLNAVLAGQIGVSYFKQNVTVPAPNVSVSSQGGLPNNGVGWSFTDSLNGVSGSVRLVLTITNQPQDGSYSRLAFFRRVNGSGLLYEKIGDIAPADMPHPAASHYYVYDSHDVTKGVSYDWACAFEDAQGGEAPQIVTSGVENRFASNSVGFIATTPAAVVNVPLGTSTGQVPYGNNTPPVINVVNSTGGLGSGAYANASGAFPTSNGNASPQNGYATLALPPGIWFLRCDWQFVGNNAIAVIANGSGMSNFIASTDTASDQASSCACLATGTLSGQQTAQFNLNVHYTPDMQAPGGAFVYFSGVWVVTAFRIA